VVTLAGSGCVPTEVPSSSATAPVASVTVSPAADNLLTGDPQRLVALLKDGKGRPRAGNDISWTSVNAETATVSPTGVGRGDAPGMAQIVATREDKSGTVVITVLAPRKGTAECDAPKSGWIWCDDFEMDRVGSYFECGPIDNDVLCSPGRLGALFRCVEETGAWLVGPLYCFGEPAFTKVHMARGTAHVEVREGARYLSEKHHFPERPLEGVGPKIQRMRTDPCRARNWVIPPPLARSALPYFMLRWSDASNRASLRHFLPITRS